MKAVDRRALQPTAVKHEMLPGQPAHRRGHARPVFMPTLSPQPPRSATSCWTSLLATGALTPRRVRLAAPASSGGATSAARAQRQAYLGSSPQAR
ncbi:conserved hypothetical protein, partial [Ricinus communis]